MAGREGHDSGNIVFRRDLRVGQLDQDPYLTEGLTVLEACFRTDNEVVKTLAAYEEALNANDTAALENLIHQMDHYKAWDY